MGEMGSVTQVTSGSMWLMKDFETREGEKLGVFNLNCEMGLPLIYPILTPMKVLYVT